MSRTSLTPRCTPPMPPVTKTRMPAASAMCSDAATVVPPLNPMATATGMSRGPIFLTHLARASISSSDLDRPTRILPETRAVVAGMAPPLRTMPSSSCASSRLIGYGMPCVMMADSRATTGVPLRRASWTSSATTNSSGLVSRRLTPSANPLVTLLPVLRPVSWSFSLRCALLTMMDSSEVCCGPERLPRRPDRTVIRRDDPADIRKVRNLPLCQSWTSSVLSGRQCFFIIWVLGIFSSPPYTENSPRLTNWEVDASEADDMTLDKFTTKSAEALQQAARFSEGHGNQATDSLHLLRAILDQKEGLAASLFPSLNVPAPAP